VVMLAEGLDVFRYETPHGLAGRTVQESGIRESTGCSVVAIETPAGVLINPPPDTVIPEVSELILIGTTDGERQFIHRFRI
jgi:voltage-gated potassium channel